MFNEAKNREFKFKQQLSIFNSDKDTSYVNTNYKVLQDASRS